MIKMRVTDDGMRATLQGVSEALGDLRPVWKDVHDVLIDMVKENFESEGARSGQDWVPLNPSYAAWKRSNYPGKPMMRLTDRLYRSLVRKSDSEHVYRTGPSFMEFGTITLYARAQQFGYPPRNLPARAVLPKMTKVEGEAIVDLILAHILKGAKRSATRGAR